jgi:hypothetical protein
LIPAVELERAEHRTVIGHREGGHAVLDGPAEDRGGARVRLGCLDARRAVQQRVLGVGVQVDELTG